MRNVDHHLCKTEGDQMLRITLGSVRVLLGVAAAGLALWGGWMLGTYLAEKVVGESGPSGGMAGSQPEEAGSAEPLWQRKFSPVSGG